MGGLDIDDSVDCAVIERQIFGIANPEFEAIDRVRLGR